MSRVAVVFTGGTISMRVDPVAGGNVPSLDGAAILARTPGLDEIADVEAIDYGLVPASHFRFPQLFEIAGLVRDALSRTDVDGAVIVQGTDTIEETSFFHDLVLKSDKPVVVTGAMRSASEDGYDGPANLRDSVRVAASSALRGAGVVVVMAGAIHAADDVTKTHTSSMTAFQSLNLGPLGEVNAGRVLVSRRRAGRRHVATTRAAEPVPLITATVSMDPSVVSAVLRGGNGPGARGLVIEGTGSGNTMPELLEECRLAMAAGVPVVLTTRSPAGRAGTGYAFPGGGAHWARAGAILGGYLGGPKARVALALGLGGGLDRDGLAALFDDSVA
jgi:L-asparaginase